MWRAGREGGASAQARPAGPGNGPVSMECHPAVPQRTLPSHPRPDNRQGVGPPPTPTPTPTPGSTSRLTSL
ncbi:hypothetical protein chiPu_0023740 [Chiloscyllium punctatum]|uniref:Uncharacterized protein n=1 Tax=Chiloscyllium punctatum TaxID=137246 RepID=A0A401TBG9_CHIPU|nr:hypothetical protein [Chiloscyllium punctatum]